MSQHAMGMDIVMQAEEERAHAILVSVDQAAVNVLTAITSIQHAFVSMLKLGSEHVTHLPSV